MILQKQYEDISFSGYYNVGPDECDCITTGELVQLFCDKWGEITWNNQAEANAPHEANFLKLDCSKLKSVFGWKPRWHVDEAIMRTVEWSKDYFSGLDISATMEKQILDFIKE